MKPRVVLRVVALTSLASLVAIETAAPALPPSPAATARTLCHDILGSRALNSDPVTVGTVRQFTYGFLNIHPAPHAFPGLGANRVVGLCWTGRPKKLYVLYAVASGYKPVRLQGVGGSGQTSTPPPGFMAIP